VLWGEVPLPDEDPTGSEDDVPLDLEDTMLKVGDGGAVVVLGLVDVVPPGSVDAMPA
jgi:hypothetical protein